MKTIQLLIACAALTGCVSADCERDCYIVDFRKYNELLEQKCLMGSVDFRCDDRKSKHQIGY